MMDDQFISYYLNLSLEMEKFIIEFNLMTSAKDILK